MSKQHADVEFSILLTKSQVDKIKQIFEEYPDLETVSVKQTALTGVGSRISVEFKPTANVVVDITDVSRW
jgi:hypothetical protein